MVGTPPLSTAAAPTPLLARNDRRVNVPWVFILSPSHADVSPSELGDVPGRARGIDTGRPSDGRRRGRGSCILVGRLASRDRPCLERHSGRFAMPLPMQTDLRPAASSAVPPSKRFKPAEFLEGRLGRPLGLPVGGCRGRAEGYG